MISLDYKGCLLYRGRMIPGDLEKAITQCEEKEVSVVPMMYCVAPNFRGSKFSNFMIKIS